MDIPLKVDTPLHLGDIIDKIIMSQPGPILILTRSPITATAPINDAYARHIKILYGWKLYKDGKITLVDVARHIGEYAMYLNSVAITLKTNANIWHDGSLASWQWRMCGQAADQLIDHIKESGLELVLGEQGSIQAVDVRFEDDLRQECIVRVDHF